MAASENLANGSGLRERGLVVVGVDGSAGSRAALAHAVGQAIRRDTDLLVVSAYVPAPGADDGAGAAAAPEALHAATAARARAVVDEVFRGGEVVDLAGGIELFVTEGPAGSVLVEQARDAELLVVGNRGETTASTALLGAVALDCVTRAACPVVVVPPGPPAGPLSNRVVVGLDASADSRAALRAAVEEAVRRRGSVDAVTVWEQHGRWNDLAATVPPSYGGVRTDLLRAAKRMVKEVLAEAPQRVPVQVSVQDGEISDVLVERARTAALLVVGRPPGRGSLRHLVVGSVSLRCVVAAACPVMVVRARPAGAPEPVGVRHATSGRSGAGVP